MYLEIYLLHANYDNLYHGPSKAQDLKLKIPYVSIIGNASGRQFDCRYN